MKGWRDYAEGVRKVNPTLDEYTSSAVLAIMGGT